MEKMFGTQMSRYLKLFQAAVVMHRELYKDFWEWAKGKKKRGGRENRELIKCSLLK